MAQTGPSGHRSRHSRNISTIMSGPAPMNSAPRIEMVPNPDFAFPRLSPDDAPALAPIPALLSGGRPMSMQDQRPKITGFSHRKTVSNLPAFQFNATDTSGLQADQTPPLTPCEAAPEDYTELGSGPVPAPTTPSRHRRTNSEYVGGDSRLGMARAISSSPTKSLLPAAAGRPTAHKHRRSVAVSSHDLSNMMQPTEPAPRLSTSLPTTPMEPLTHSPGADTPSTASDTGLADPFGPAIDDDSSSRPPSRPRVGFSDNVEYIPRPLSTISSETESSMSTVRGHSVNNSITSVLSLGTPSPPSSRARASTLETTFEDEHHPRARSSLEISKRVEKEGEWLRAAASRPTCTASSTRQARRATKISFASMNSPVKARHPYPLARFSEIDRRRSEPLIGQLSDEPTQHSALSLQETELRRPLSEHSGVYALAKKTTSKKTKIKDWRKWAKSRLLRKSRDCTPERYEESASASSIELTPSATSSELSVPGLVQMSENPVAETDLDAVLNSQASPIQARASFAQIDFQMPSAPPPPPQQQHPVLQPRDSDEYNYMLDLDAALGPFKTPRPLSTPVQTRPIREMHSSRLTKDFTGPGGHYYPEPAHRRTKSTPIGKLDQALYMPTQERMQDVFEEDEEDDETFAKGARPSSNQSNPDEESCMGVQIVDLEPSVGTSSSCLDLDGDVRMSTSNWELERPAGSYGFAGSRLSTPLIEKRASSLIEETIFEESSPVEPVEIVQAHEEPRAPSLTKSSDSSDTPTLLAAQPAVLNLPDGSLSISTSKTYQDSTFSTPDFAQRQGSFDNSRVGTAASSIADSRTMSSYTTGEPAQELRISVDDIPSLTSSRSTMLSTFHANTSRRDLSGTRTSSTHSAALNTAVAAVAAEERRRKRSSIQSLSQLMGGSFGPRVSIGDESRPHTANEAAEVKGLRKKDNRLKKLMFWKTKQRQVSTSTTTTT